MLCVLMKRFDRIHGTHPIGMVSYDPISHSVYTAAKNFNVQQFSIENAQIKQAGEIRIKDISSVEVSNRDISKQIADHCRCFSQKKSKDWSEASPMSTFISLMLTTVGRY